MLYWVQEAFANIRLNRTTTVIAVATTAFTLACFGVFLLLYLNLKEMADSLHEDFQVVVYVSDDLAAQDISKLRQTVKEDPGVESLTYVSKDSTPGSPSQSGVSIRRGLAHGWRGRAVRDRAYRERL